MEQLTFKVEAFEGPLDLMLHLIQKNKLDIFEVSVLALIDQYMAQIRAMRQMDMELASEFLAMAARLVHIKTVSLLPKHELGEELQNELIGELIEYQLVKQMAGLLSEQTLGFEMFESPGEPIEFDRTYTRTHPAEELYHAYIAAAGRGQRRVPPPNTSFRGIVAKRIVPVSSKVVFLMRTLRSKGKTTLRELFQPGDTRSDIVATFLALLELLKSERIKVSGRGDNPEIKMMDKRR